MVDKVRSLLDTFSTLDRKLGFWKIFRYCLLIALFTALYNYKAIVRDFIEIYEQVNREEHDRRIQVRDQLLHELNPTLREMMGQLGADRVLYFEYHNSKENLVGIPFKYVDLILYSTKWQSPPFNPEKLKSINSGRITYLFEDLKEDEVLIYRGVSDYDFLRKYPGIVELMSSGDPQELGNQGQLAFVNVPGIRVPIGLVVFEWLNSDEARDWGRIERDCHTFSTRINAVVIENSKRL